jgi:Fe-S-cluster-containing hydrogenase component 2
VENVVNVVKSGVIIHDEKTCTGCGICELMCSLYHEGVQGPALARSAIMRQPFTFNHTHSLCQQCSPPNCYLACPLKDEAMRLDTTSGVAYIVEDECTGCGICIDACTFDPPRIKINVAKNTAYKCDLCRGRERGPICIEYCPFQALKLLSGDKR